MRRFTHDDFPITATGHNVYRRSESSPICTCADMSMATAIAERLNASEGIKDKKAARGQPDDIYNGDHSL